MNFTEVNVEIAQGKAADHDVLAFCSVVIDDALIIRDIRIINVYGRPLVAMPNRLQTARCSKCGTKNHLRAKFCNKCGVSLVPSRENHRALHSDIVHPISPASRASIQEQILQAYKQKLMEEASQLVRFIPRGP